jgi:hypothetical protein
MKVGDSFLLPKGKRASIATQAKIAGIKTMTRTVDEATVRVWRIE